MQESAFEGTRTQFAYRALCCRRGEALSQKAQWRVQEIQTQACKAAGQCGSEWDYLMCEKEFVSVAGKYTAEEFESKIQEVCQQPGLAFVEKLRHCLVEGIETFPAHALIAIIRLEELPSCYFRTQQKVLLAV